MIKTCLRCVRSCHRLLLICDKLSSFGVELGCAGLALSSRLTKSTSVIGMGPYRCTSEIVLLFSSRFELLPFCYVLKFFKLCKVLQNRLKLCKK